MAGSRNRFKKREGPNNSLGSAALRIAKNTGSSLKRAYDHRGDQLAIRRSEVTGNTDQLTDRQYEQQMKIGTKITEGGKDLYWSGQNYGWQSKGSYDKLSEKGEFRGGEITAQRINNDLGEGIQAVLGEEGTRRLGLAITKATETYDQHAPQVVKDTVRNIGGGLSQANQAISKATGIGPTVTGELLTEVALLGSGQALKVGGKALKAAAPISRVQELQRGLRGRNARPLNTAGSVGAAGAPQPRPLSIIERAQQRDRNFVQQLRGDTNAPARPTTPTPRQTKLSKAKPYSGRRLENDAADGIQKVSTNNAPKNTVTSKGQTRGADKAKRVEQQVVQTRRQALLDDRDRNLRMIGNEQRLAERTQGPAIERFGQLDRAQQAQRNVVRRRDEVFPQRRAADQRRARDTNRRIQSPESNRATSRMEHQYDVVVNEDRMPVSGLARNTVQSGGSNARIRAPRTQNTVDGRRVINDSENRALRMRERQVEADRQLQIRANIDQQNETIAARNRIAGKPKRQQAAVERAKDIGNDRLAEANTTRRNSPNKTGLKRQGYATEASRPANTLKASKRIGKKAEASKKARETATKTAKVDRSKASVRARQGSGKKKANATFKDGPQPNRGGEEGSRLFTPSNRAKAAQNAARKTLKDGLVKDRYGDKIRRSRSAGMESYAIDKRGDYDLGFRDSFNGSYDRPSEKGRKDRRSNVRRRLKGAATKDQLGLLMDEVKIGKDVTADPTSKERMRGYRMKTKGVLEEDGSGHVAATRTGPKTWDNKYKEDVEFDPKSLGEELAELAKTTPKQLQGRALKGGSSLRIKAKDVRGTRAKTPTKRPDNKTKTYRKREKASRKRIEKALRRLK